MNAVCTTYDVNGEAARDATAQKEQKGEWNMAGIMARNNAKRKESKAFPYEMTELVWEGEEELQKLLRREVRKIELEIKHRMLWQQCRLAGYRFRDRSLT